jgi:D-3-phosphoglycerate dehydrogenase/(S)-sulfolactate dehydrogenase
VRIVVSEMIHAEALSLLQHEAEVHYDPTLHAHRGVLAKALHQAEALIVRNQTRVDLALLEHARTLKVVGRIGVGLDNLDLACLRDKGVTVTWAPGTNAVSVAEYVMGAMLELSRRFGEASTRLHTGEWNRQAAIGSELYGKTLGIVGLGDIGARLARRAGAFGMRLLASDPVAHGSSYAVQEYDVELTGLNALLEEADFVSLHLPLLPSTRGLIGREALAKMRAHAFLINTARGGLIDETALAEALRERRLAGAAIDVRENEPPGESDPLRGLPNAILTPHIAGVTHESNHRASLHVARDVLRVLAGERPISPVP